MDTELHPRVDTKNVTPERSVHKTTPSSLQSIRAQLKIILYSVKEMKARFKKLQWRKCYLMHKSSLDFYNVFFSAHSDFNLQEAHDKLKNQR